jgi:acetylglutamate kinase
MVLNGLINTRILAICRDLNLPAVGLSGVDGGLIKAHKRAAGECEGHDGGPVDYGFVGDIDSVDPDVIQAARQRPDAGRQPAVGRRLRHAAEHQRRYRRGSDGNSARRREADPAPWVRPASSKIARTPPRSSPTLDLDDLEELRENGSHRRRHAAEGACHRGSGARRRAARARDFLQGPRQPAAEIFTNEGTGTLVVEDTDTLTPEEQEAGA